MKKEMKKKNNKGFSLVELIVVIAIMAVLMVVLAPAMLRYVEKTRVQKDDSAASEIQHAVELALAQEDVNNEAKGGAITVTLTGNTGAITYANSDASAATALLQAEVENTVGTTVSMSSKSRSAAGVTYVITATYNSTRMAYIVQGSWSGL